MTESKKPNKSKIELNMRVGRSFGDLEDVKANKKGILKVTIPIIVVGAIILFTLFK